MSLPQIIKLHLKDSSFLLPLWPRQIAKFCTTLMCLCRFHVMWCVSLESHTDLPAQFCRVWHCFNIMRSLLVFEVSPLLLPPALHKAHPTQLKIRTYKICTFFQGWHVIFLLWFKYLMLCSLVSQTVLFFFLFRCSLSYFEEKPSLVVHIQHDYWT